MSYVCRLNPNATIYYVARSEVLNINTSIEDNSVPSTGRSDFYSYKQTKSATARYKYSYNLHKQAEMPARKLFNSLSVDKQAVAVITVMMAVVASYFAFIESPASFFNTEVSSSKSGSRSSPSP